MKNRKFLSQLGAGLLAFSVSSINVLNATELPHLVQEPEVQESELYALHRTSDAGNDDTTSTKLNSSAVEVTNNVEGVKDTIKVIGVQAGTIIKVYDTEDTRIPLVTGKVETGKDSITLQLSQLTVTAGRIYITATEPEKAESARTEVEYKAEEVTSIEDVEVEVTNNANANDTVVVTNVESGDIIKVYKEDGITVLGRATVAKGKTEVTISIKQIGEEEGKIKVTRTSKGKRESEAVEKEVAAEERTKEVNEGDVTVENNKTGKKDTITVTGLSAGTVVKVYETEESTKAIATATAREGKDTALSVTQLGDEEGSIFVTLTEVNKQESTKVEKGFEAEKQTATIGSDRIIVKNNAEGTKDTITVKELDAGVVVKVYETKDTTKAIATATAKADTETVISVKQLGTDEGSIFVTVTDADKNESNRVEVQFGAEEQTAAIDTDNVTVKNNIAGTKDTITVTGLEAGTVVKVYATEDATKAIATATAKADTETVISVAQLGDEEGSVFVTLTEVGKAESEKTEVEFKAESVTETLQESQVSVVNNANGKDIVTVTGLKEGDTVKVYNEAGKVLGTAKVAKEKTEAEVAIAQIGDEGATIKVTLTTIGSNESEALEVEVDAEAQTEAIAEGKVTVKNNIAGTKDTITVTGLEAGTVVKVYATEDATKAIATATAKADTETVISVAQLGDEEGSVFVTLTEVGKAESEKTKIVFSAVKQSGTLKAEQIVIVNNIGMDIIFVYGLEAGDTIKVYDAQQDGKVIGRATVAQNQSQVYMTLTQIGEGEGNIYISLTKAGELEGQVTEFSFDAE